MEERINKLEALVTMQDKTITDLNAELFRQQQDLTQLQRRLKMLEQKLEKLELPEDLAGNEKPPHW